MKKAALCLGALLLSQSVIADNAITGFGFTDKDRLKGTQHHTQYHSRHTYYNYEVPAEFGYSGDWNNTLITSQSLFAGISCNNYAIGNQVVVNTEGAGNTTVIDSNQKVINSEITATLEKCKVISK